MALTALTRIVHGKDDGSRVVLEEGEDVKGLPSDVVKDLKAQGLVGEAPKSNDETLEERDELRARVAELEAQLNEARSSTAPQGGGQIVGQASGPQTQVSPDKAGNADPKTGTGKTPPSTDKK